MKREKLHLQGGMTVETGKDSNGRFYIAYARGASMFLRDTKEVRQFLRLAAKTQSRESLDSWFASLGLADRESTPPAKETERELLERWNQSGFGPECHEEQADPQDDKNQPNYQVRTLL